MHGCSFLWILLMLPAHCVTDETSENSDIRVRERSIRSAPISKRGFYYFHNQRCQYVRPNQKTPSVHEKYTSLTECRRKNPSTNGASRARVVNSGFRNPIKKFNSKPKRLVLKHSRRDSGQIHRKKGKNHKGKNPSNVKKVKALKAQPNSRTHKRKSARISDNVMLGDEPKKSALRDAKSRKHPSVKSNKSHQSISKKRKISKSKRKPAKRKPENGKSISKSGNNKAIRSRKTGHVTNRRHGDKKKPLKDRRGIRIRKKGNNPRIKKPAQKGSKPIGSDTDEMPSNDSPAKRKKGKNDKKRRNIRKVPTKQGSKTNKTGSKGKVILKKDKAKFVKNKNGLKLVNGRYVKTKRVKSGKRPKRTIKLKQLHSPKGVEACAWNEYENEKKECIRCPKGQESNDDQTGCIKIIDDPGIDCPIGEVLDKHKKCIKNMCDDGQEYYPDEEKCYPKCPPEKFWYEDKGTCGCNTDQVEKSGKCVDCDTGLVPINGECIKLEECRGNSIMLETGKCQACPSGQIVHENQCVKEEVCDKKDHIYFNGNCEKCEPGAYASAPQDECIREIPCDIHFIEDIFGGCIECDDDEIADDNRRKCLKCKSNSLYSYKQKACAPCPNGYMVSNMKCVPIPTEPPTTTTTTTKKPVEITSTPKPPGGLTTTRSQPGSVIKITGAPPPVGVVTEVSKTTATITTLKTTTTKKKPTTSKKPIKSTRTTRRPIPGPRRPTTRQNPPKPTTMPTDYSDEDYEEGECSLWYRRRKVCTTLSQLVTCISEHTPQHLINIGDPFKAMYAAADWWNKNRQNTVGNALASLNSHFRKKATFSSVYNMAKAIQESMLVEDDCEFIKKFIPLYLDGLNCNFKRCQNDFDNNISVMRVG